MTSQPSDDYLFELGQRVLRLRDRQDYHGKVIDSQIAHRRLLREEESRFSNRTCLWNAPERVDGFIELCQRNSPAIAARIRAHYEDFLKALASGDEVGFEPLRIDFHKLPHGARPYLLAGFLNIRIGNRHPYLCFDQSSVPGGRLTYVSPGGPIDASVWEQALPIINGYLGDAWSIARVAVDTITLVRRTPLPAVMPFAPSMLKSGHLFIGINVADHQPYYLPLQSMTSGTFIPGASGTGKSNALDLLLQSIFANLEQFAAVYLVDGKDGVSMNRYRSVAPNKVIVLWEERDLWTITSELVATMRARNVAQREANRDNATSDFIAVVIDEMSTFTAKPTSDSKHPDTKRHAQFIDELAMLARRGRSTGIRLIITAQEPVVDQIPATVRANCLTTLAFKLPIDVHANAVFGQLEGLPADPRRLSRGRALLKNGLTGDLHYLQIPLRGSS
jgi:hypothetical protein